MEKKTSRTPKTSWTKKTVRAKVTAVTPRTSKTRKILRTKEKDFKTLHEAHGRLSKRLKLVQGTANLFLNITKVEQNVEKVMDFCMTAVDAEAGSILLIDDENKELYFAAARALRRKKSNRFEWDWGRESPARPRAAKRQSLSQTSRRIPASAGK